MPHRKTIQPIKVLCVTSHSDRPEAETFIGLQSLGFDIRVLSSPHARHYERLRGASVPVEPLEPNKRIDKAAVARIRREIDEVEDVFRSRNSFPAGAAAIPA